MCRFFQRRWARRNQCYSYSPPQCCIPVPVQCSCESNAPSGLAPIPAPPSASLPTPSQSPSPSDRNGRPQPPQRSVLLPSKNDRSSNSESKSEPKHEPESDPDQEPDQEPKPIPKKDDLTVRAQAELKRREADLAKREQALREREQQARARDEQAKKEREELTKLTDKLGSQQRDQDRRGQDLDRTEQRLGAMGRQLDARQGELNRTEQDLNALAEQLTGERKKQEDTRKELSNLNQNLQTLAESLKKQQTELGSDQSELAEMRRSAAAQAEAQKKKQDELDELSKRAGAQSESLDRREKALAALDAELKKRKTQLDSEQTKNGDELAQFQRDTDAAKKEREQLTAERAASGKLKQDLEREQKKQREEADALGVLQARLEARERELKAQQAEMDSRAKMLAALEGEMDARNRALKLKEDAAGKAASGPSGPIEIGKLPQLPPAAKPDWRWDSGPPIPPRTVGPSRTPNLDVPDWMYLVTATNFDREHLERSFSPTTSAEMRAGRDYEARQKLEQESASATGDARKAVDAHRDWFDVNIYQAYKPILSVHSSLQNLSVTLERLHGWNGSSKPESWNDDSRKEVKDLISNVVKAYRVALQGAAPEDKYSPAEERVGAAEKVKAIQARIEALSKKVESDRSPIEIHELDFLLERKARMEEFIDWLGRLEPYIKQLEKRSESLEDFSPLMKEVPQRAEASSAAALPEQLRAAADSLFSKPTTAGEAPDVAAFEKELETIKRVPSADPTRIEAELGAAPQLAQLRQNLEHIDRAMQDPKFIAQLAETANAAAWAEVSAALGTSGTITEKQKLVTAAYQKHIRGGITPGRIAAINALVSQLYTEKSDGTRTELIKVLLEPVFQQSTTDVGERVAALREKIKQTSENIACCSTTLNQRALAAESDRAYLSFAGSIPNYADYETARRYSELPAAERTTIRADLERRRIAAAQAIEKELEALKDYERREQTTELQYYLARIKRLKGRLKNMDDWNKNDSRL